MVNLQTLIKGIPGIIPGGISVKDFSMAANISEELSVHILDNFIQNGIGKFENDLFYFSENDRLKTGILAISMGAPIDEISTLLEWQDFESLAGEILANRNFDTSFNVILTNPRRQIDVIGIKDSLAILVDCKHWNRMTNSSLETAVRKQIERTKQFVAKKKGISAAVPAIVTLYQNELKFIDRVPIIPIYQLDSFCEELYGNLEDVRSQSKV